MIYRVRTITMSAETMAASRPMFVQAIDYINQHYPDVHCEILVNLSGALNQIHWLTRCQSLGALEAYEAQRQNDTEWQQIVAAWQAVPGAKEMVDHFYQVLAE